MFYSLQCTSLAFLLLNILLYIILLILFEIIFFLILFLYCSLIDSLFWYLASFSSTSSSSSLFPPPPLSSSSLPPSSFPSSSWSSSSFIALARNSCTMLKVNSDRKHPCHFPHHSERLFLLDIELLGNSHFCTLNTSSHCRLASMSSDGKSRDNLIEVSLYIMLLSYDF